MQVNYWQIIFCGTLTKTSSKQKQGETNKTLKCELFVFADVNECSREGHGCEQICINTVGSYYCVCRNGYFLHEDRRTCLGRTVFKIFFL